MSQTITRPVRHRRRIIPMVLLLFIVAIMALVLLWNWDWFIPIVEARASAALGRKVTIEHLHVRLGRDTTVAADNVVVANPDGFESQKPLAMIERLSVTASVMDYINRRAIVLPDVTVDKPDIHAIALPDGRNNWTVKLAGTRSSTPSNAPPPQIGNLTITDGTAAVIDPKVKSSFALGIATFPATATRPAELVVTSKGTYAGQPVTGHFVGGALLSLRDTAHPYPIDLHVENGQTKMALVGTVENPLNFAGARLRLTFAGPDMSQLYPLTNIPFPQTPPFSLAGKLDYAKPNFRFTNIEGRVGSSDLSGTIEETAEAGGKPDVTMDLVSHRLDLADLGGFIGATPGKKSTPGETPAQEAQLDRASKKKTLLPDTPLNLPKLRAADLHVKYRGEHIENRFTPFDKLYFDLDVVDGRITLHPLDVSVGDGQIASTIDLSPGARDIVHANAKIDFREINISRLMQATHTFHGQGIIGGEAEIDTNGNSLASMMGQGNGELKLSLVSGGNLSALLIDLTGLEFGNALLSELGVPNRANIDCFYTDLPMHNGVVDTKVLLLDTNEARLVGKGSIDFTNQTLNYSITTRSKNFSIGSLPGPIDITGPLGDPSIRPGTEVVARAGAAVGLGVLLTPIGALLPTIQFGVGKDNACYKAHVEEKKPLRAPAPPRRTAHR